MALRRLAFTLLIFQVLVGVWWIANLFLEWAFASSTPRQGSSSESLLFGLLFLLALASIAVPISVGIAISRAKISRKYYSAVLLIGALFPFVVRLPAHPVGSLVKVLATIPAMNKLSEVAFAKYATDMSRLKERAEILRKNFDSGRNEIACEWFANDPIAPPHKFVACKKLIESIKDPDLRWQQLDHFRAGIDFKTWFEAQKNFDGSGNQAYSGEAAVIPVEEQSWFIGTILSTFAEVSDDIFEKNYGSVGRALSRATEDRNSRWSVESKQEIATFPKELLYLRAERIGKKDGQQLSETRYFMELLKNERKD